jgi:hypothetical protein
MKAYVCRSGFESSFDGTGRSPTTTAMNRDDLPAGVGLILDNNDNARVEIYKGTNGFIERYTYETVDVTVRA